MLGYIYWTERALARESYAKKSSRPIQWTVASLHGFAMCTTRLMGAPVVPMPALQWLGKRFDGKLLSDRGFLPFLVCVLAAFGFLSFFVYCQVHFGAWNLYSLTSACGWGVSSNPWAALNPLLYLPKWFFENTEVSLDWSIAPLTVIGLLLAFRRDTSRVKRMGYYFSILSMHILLMSAKAGMMFVGMARHGFTVMVLLVILFAQFPETQTRLKVPPWLKKSAYFLAVLIMLGLQIYLASRFTRGRWVE